jgi:hypothetical protein
MPKADFRQVSQRRITARHCSSFRIFIAPRKRKAELLFSALLFDANLSARLSFTDTALGS